MRAEDAPRPWFLPTALVAAGVIGVLLAFGYTRNHAIVCAASGGGYPGSGEATVYGGCGLGAVFAAAGGVAFVVLRGRLPRHYCWLGVFSACLTVASGAVVFWGTAVGSAFACGFF